MKRLLIPIALMVLSCSFSAYASTDSPSPVPPPVSAVDPVVGYIAKSNGVSLGEATIRAAMQDKVPVVSDAIIKYAGDRFAGIYGDADSNLVVLLKMGELRDSGYVNDLATTLGIPGRLRIASASYSAAELTAYSDNLLKSMMSTALKDLPFVLGPSLQDQQVHVNVPKSVVATVQQLIVKYQPGAPIVVVGDDSIARPVTCSYADDCDPPLRGGTGMYTGGMEECTSAFLSRSRTDNKLYMLTAGHCTYFFAGASWNEHTASGTAHVLGTSYKSSYHTALNHDAGLILVSNTTYWQARACKCAQVGRCYGATVDCEVPAWCPHCGRWR